MPQCAVENCDKSAQKRGYCDAHYKRFWRHGDPLGGTASPGEPLAWLKNNVSFCGDDCLTWPFAKGANGRGGIYFRRKITRPARAMCILAHGEPPEGMVVAHSCGRGHEGCVNPHHIRWATQADNEADKVRHGTSNRGQGNGMAKLSREQALQIRRKTDHPPHQLAEQFSVSESCVRAIWAGRRWKHA